MTPIIKYPRTPHIEGSRLQAGDEDLAQVPMEELKGRFLVVEEKLDGSNCGISFDSENRLLLQSRGHALTGGANERQFNLLKSWAVCHEQAFRQVLARRFVLYGEWMYAMHTIYYDALPHYFLEFDLWDRETATFLSTERRRAMLGGLPIVSVPVLAEGAPGDPRRLLGRSAYRSAAWRDRLRVECSILGVDAERAVAECDQSLEMEGLYIKWEEDGRVLDRYKYVRAGFLASVRDSMTHWMDRPIVPNQLRDGVELFG